MTRRPRHPHLLLAAVALSLTPLLGAAGALAAQAPTPTAGLRSYVVDRASSEINFTAPSRLLDAHGTFDKWSADVQADPAHPDRSVVRIVIDAASIDTRISKRDDHLRSPEFFDAAKYPQITFVSKSIEKTSPDNGTIVGDLAMRGVTKQIAVPITMAFFDGSRGTFRGKFVIDRKAWGIDGNSMMNPVQDDITVDFTINIVNAASAAGR